MENDRKTEPGSRPSGELGDDKKLANLSIPDLISELRIATQIKQFDQVEQVLVDREAELKDEVNKMRQVLELENLEKMEIEAKLKKCQELCEKRKRGEMLYEKLLANVKKNGLEDTNVEELRAKNRELESELKMWKGKFTEFNERILKMEHETQFLVKERNNEFILKVKEEKETDEIHVHGGNSGNNNNVDSNVSQRNCDTCKGIGQSSKNPNKDVSAASGRLGLGTTIGNKELIVIKDSDDDDEEKEGYCRFVRDNGHRNSSAAATAEQESKPRKEDVNGMLKRKYGSRDSACQFQKKKWLDNDEDSSGSSGSTELKQILQRIRLTSHVQTTDKRSKAN